MYVENQEEKEILNESDIIKYLEDGNGLNIHLFILFFLVVLIIK
jgi:hypothetical protein